VAVFVHQPLVLAEKKKCELGFDIFRLRISPKKIRGQDEEESPAATCRKRRDALLDEFDRRAVEQMRVGDADDEDEILLDEAIDCLMCEVQGLRDATVVEVRAAARSEIRQLSIRVVREPVCDRGEKTKRRLVARGEVEDAVVVDGRQGLLNERFFADAARSADEAARTLVALIEKFSVELLSLVLMEHKRGETDIHDAGGD
jgi:hypothetical protein